MKTRHLIVTMVLAMLATIVGVWLMIEAIQDTDRIQRGIHLTLAVMLLYCSNLLMNLTNDKNN